MTPLEAQRATALARTEAFRRAHDGRRHALDLMAVLRGQA